MTTNELVRLLAGSVVPVPPRALHRRLLLGFGSGLAAAVVLSTVAPGRDLAQHSPRGAALWLNLLYSGSLGAAGLYLAAQFARPGQEKIDWAPLLGLPVIVIAALAATELAIAPDGDWRALLFPPTWEICPALLLLFALPVTAGLWWSFRIFAPTRLRAAGASTGIAAGAASACLYSLRCVEVSPVFVLTWCTLGILLSGLLGAIVGPRILRW